jgi:hypothetical protein
VDGLGTRVCAREDCGEVFTPRRSDARYCSGSCRAQASAGRRKRSETKHTVADIPTQPAVTAVVPASWEPVVSTANCVRTSEPCPDCGEPLYATLRGTRRVCLPCARKVVPRGVAAPYDRAAAGVRQVKSQRECDLEAIGLARRKGVMLAQLAELGIDDRLHPESRPVVDWFAEQVKAAASGARLDELAARLPEAGIRRRGWLTSRPAALPVADDYDDEHQADDADCDDDVGADQDFYDHHAREVAKISLTTCPTSRTLPAGNLSGPAWTRPGPVDAMTWAEALARLGWRIIPSASGCQVSEGAAACGITGAVRNIGGDGRACYQHYQNLATVIMRSQ